MTSKITRTFTSMTITTADGKEMTFGSPDLSIDMPQLPPRGDVLQGDISVTAELKPGTLDSLFDFINREGAFATDSVETRGPWDCLVCGARPEGEETPDDWFVVTIRLGDDDAPAAYARFCPDHVEEGHRRAAACAEIGTIGGLAYLFFAVMYCECEEWDVDDFADDSSAAEPLRCKHCSGVVPCEFCHDDTPATTSHIDYVTCAQHHSAAVDNVHSRTEPDYDGDDDDE